MISDKELLAAFENCSWPLENWHHREHIKIAYLYLCEHPLDVAITKMCRGIRAYNAAQKVHEAIDAGYHETTTQAWMQLVHCTLSEFGPKENADAFVDEHTHLLAKRALRFFYSRNRIMSAEAKKTFIEPDLAPLPRSARNGKAGAT